MLIETNYVKRIQDKIDELKDELDECDGRESKAYLNGQIDILKSIALPQARFYEWNEFAFSECANRKDSKIQELYNEIRSLKGDLK